MLEKQSVEKVIQIFHHSTELPILSIDCQQLISFKMMKDIESSTVMSYLEWQEALDFLKTISANSGCIRKNYTYYTTNGFIYSIIPLEMKQNDFEALISGPFLSTHPDENQIEAMAKQYHFNEDQKLRFRSILKNLPLASRERMDYLGRLLLALLKAEEQSSSIQTMPEDHLPNKTKIIKTLCETTVPQREKEEYLSLQTLCLKLKDRITYGCTVDTENILMVHAKSYWNMKAGYNLYRELKNKCIILCTLACLFAFQGNTPHAQTIDIMDRFIKKIEHSNSSEMTIKELSNAVESFSHLVNGALTKNYSLHSKRAMQYIKGHYTEKITLKHLAQRFKLSPEYLSTLIKKETGQTLSENINKIRIEESKKLLVYSDKSIQEITCNVGFNYQNHFDTVFKKYVGMTPMEFRRKNGTHRFF